MTRQVHIGKTIAALAAAHVIYCLTIRWWLLGYIVKPTDIIDIPNLFLLAILFWLMGEKVQPKDR